MSTRNSKRAPSRAQARKGRATTARVQDGGGAAAARVCVVCHRRMAADQVARIEGLGLDFCSECANRIETSRREAGLFFLRDLLGAERFWKVAELTLSAGESAPTLADFLGQAVDLQLARTEATDASTKVCVTLEDGALRRRKAMASGRKDGGR